VIKASLCKVLFKHIEQVGNKQRAILLSASQRYLITLIVPCIYFYLELMKIWNFHLPKKPDQSL